MTQKLSPVKNDWCLTIAEDLKYLNINLSEKEISMMKKAKFKTLVNQKVQECAISFLSDLKQKHSKSDGIKVSNSMQSYLTSNELSCEEKQFLFSLRTRTFDCKANYSHKFNNNLNCLNCHDSVDEQQHLLLCPKLTSGVDLNNIKYEDIFGSVKKQIAATKVLKKLVEKRAIIINDSSIAGGQAHLP